MQISPSPAFSVWNFTKQEAQVGMNHIMQPVFLLGKIAETCTFLAHLSRRLEWAIVIAHRPSSVRPSVRRPSVWRKLFIFSTSSPETLDGFWWNLVGMKYSWSLTSFVVFRPDPPRGGSRAGPKYVTGGPLLQQTSSSDRKATATNQMHSSDLEACGKKCCYFGSIPKSNFWRVFDVFLDFVIFAIFLCNFYRFLLGKVHYLHLFWVISMFISGRMLI